MKGGLKFLGLNLAVWAYIIIAIVGLSALGLWIYSWMYPAQLRIERQANQESQQMVQSVTEQLRADMESWYKLDSQAQTYEQALNDPNVTNKDAVQTALTGVRAQQEQLVIKMHTDADSLARDAYNQLPRDILDFLASHN